MKIQPHEEATTKVRCFESRIEVDGWQWQNMLCLIIQQ